MMYRVQKTSSSIFVEYLQKLDDYYSKISSINRKTSITRISSITWNFQVIIV